MKSKLWALFGLFLMTGMVDAQDATDIKLSSTYAIQNAHVIQKPGKSIEQGTVIIKDGVITAVGKNVAIPADAIIVKADSMYVYPGFIDAYNNIGVKKEEDDGNQERVKNPGYPPNDRAGIMPDRSLSDVFSGSEKSISSWREVGFTASMSAPKGGMLPGKTSLIIHSGGDASQSIILEDNGVLGTFENARRMYPATIIGVMAKYRDLFRQTGYAAKHVQAYKSSPNGMARPSYDKSLKALMPVADKSQYLYFEAEKMKDIARAMTLQEDLGFNMALINVKQGERYIDKIKANKIPVVLSMEVPASDEKKKEKDKKEGEEQKDEEELDPEMEALKARRTAAIIEYQSQAAMFAKSGVTFALSGKDIKGNDVKKNAKLMMEHGLTEDQVLAALTTNPAEMFGVSNIMGTVEEGKMANLFVSTSPYFEKDSKIKYVFVEGVQFEYEIAKKKAKVEGEEGDLSGLYSCTVEVPGEQQDIKINITKDGEDYEVTVENDGEETEADNVFVEGNKISFPLDVENQGFTMKLDFTLTIDEGDVDGSVAAGDFGTFPVKGQRIADPKN